MIKQPMSIALARSIEALAREIVSAAALYQTRPRYHDPLAAGLETLVGRLNEDVALFLRYRAEEAAHGPR
jgi:hypothetical protein